MKGRLANCERRRTRARTYASTAPGEADRKSDRQEVILSTGPEIVVLGLLSFSVCLFKQQTIIRVCSLLPSLKAVHNCPLAETVP